MYCHNNNAERPFGVMKAFQKQYPSMSVSMLGAMTHARMSGVFKDGGAFTSSDPRLQKSVDDLCCIHEKKPGEITTLLRNCKSEDLKTSAVNRKKHTQKNTWTNRRSLPPERRKKTSTLKAEI